MKNNNIITIKPDPNLRKGWLSGAVSTANPDLPHDRNYPRRRSKNGQSIGNIVHI